MQAPDNKVYEQSLELLENLSVSKPPKGGGVRWSIIFAEEG